MAKENVQFVPWQEAEVPEATKTYQPISHQDLIDLVTERLSLQGYTVISKSVNQNFKGTRIAVNMVVYKNGGEEDFTMMIAYTNSYDKTLPINVASGARVFICENGMVVGDIVSMRKHTNRMLLDLTEMIDKVVNNLEDVWRKTINDVERMKNTPFTDEQTASLYGVLYIIDKVVTSTELNIAVKELRNPTYPDFSGKTLWSSYNHITYALKDAPPHRKLDALKKLHDACMDTANDFHAMTPYS